MSSRLEARSAAPPRVLVVETRSRETIVAEARRSFPEEACGLLIGHEAAGRVVVSRTHRARNAASDRRRDRYRVDPRDWVRADREARRDGLAIVGVWHSHPTGGACPSAVDHETVWPEYCYLIVSAPSGALACMRAWSARRAGFVEVALE